MMARSANRLRVQPRADTTAKPMATARRWRCESGFRRTLPNLPPEHGQPELDEGRPPRHPSCVHHDHLPSDAGLGISTRSTFTAARQVLAAAGRPGPGRQCGKLGQVVQRVGEMLRAERRELDVLPDELRADSLRSWVANCSRGRASFPGRCRAGVGTGLWRVSGVSRRSRSRAVPPLCPTLSIPSSHDRFPQVVAERHVPLSERRARVAAMDEYFVPPDFDGGAVLDDEAKKRLEDLRRAEEDAARAWHDCWDD